MGVGLFISLWYLAGASISVSHLPCLSICHGNIGLHKFRQKISNSEHQIFVLLLTYTFLKAMFDSPSISINGRVYGCTLSMISLIPFKLCCRIFFLSNLVFTLSFCSSWRKNIVVQCLEKCIVSCVLVWSIIGSLILFHYMIRSCRKLQQIIQFDRYNLPDDAAAVLLRRLSNFRANWKL